MSVLPLHFLPAKPTPVVAASGFGALLLHESHPVVQHLFTRPPRDESSIAPLPIPQARRGALAEIDLSRFPPDPRLMDLLGAKDCLIKGLLPWRQIGDQTLIATSDLSIFDQHHHHLTGVFGTVSPVLAPFSAIEDAVLAQRGALLARYAESSVAERVSCRTYRAQRLHLPMVVAGILALVALLLFPALLLLGLTLIALAAMLAYTLLKLAAWAAMARPSARAAPPPHIAHLPTVSAMVALYRESNIAGRLVQRLGKLDYPRDLLDILLVVEAEDRMTRHALAEADLPPWMRVVVVPEGCVKTKPRALNFALDQCRGSIVGVYDAEDAPEPDQIRKVVTQFYSRGPEVACLQGRLDFYNPRINWLSRCFTIEYAAWFRLFLPGIAKLGLAVPLGGTTLFFRRTVLEKLGRWDAHNVTEDADLGMRLARHGYRTELLDTTTFEEANCVGRSWIKQRSRWIKGYMMTWATHMRDPVALWRELGPRQFFGFQVLILGTFLQSLLAPLLWSFWIIPLGLPHPVAALLPPEAFTALWMTFLLTETLTVAFGVTALTKTNHRLNPLWVPTLYLYHPLATISAYKAAWEMLTKPFYWDKTSHGHFDQIPG